MTKTIEEKYQKLSQREHVIKRPGMYIGSVSKVSEELWVFDAPQNKMVKRFVDYSPGFLKIVDEVLTNATDHATRDPTVTSIKVDYDTNTGEISVWNNGTGVPVVEHSEHKLYVPELIFGHLLSGSNYDDTQERTGAGTNGLGVKLCNIFSKRFVVETVDSDNKKKFVQEYTDNMEHRSKPKITSNSTKSYTKITFLPDYARFNMKSLETDTIALMNKRVYDIIACTRSDISIHLNGEKIKGKTFTDYIKYFFDDTTPIVESITQKVNKTTFIWEYAVVPSSQFEQISFVNGNATNSGGKHVDYILYQITSRLKELLETKKKLKDVKPSFIKDRLFLFLRATVINPTFNSQTKETLTTQSKDFGCKVDVSETFITKIYKSSIVEDIVEFCKLKETATLAKATDGRKVNKIYIPKLEDALWAGTAKSKECTLILTEGLSALTFAMWGRSVVGPERYGCYPLKGKALNVRDATVSQLTNNEELNSIKQILGLKQDRVYKDTNDLRYSKIMILTDADVDGSHIKSLLVNIFHAQWPSLLKLDFIQTVRTPIVKAIRGKKVIEFFTEQDYHKWKGSEPNPSNYQIRYFKGLGTSNKTDAHDTFKRIEELKMDYFYKDQKCDESILLAFEKDKNVKTSSHDTGSENAEVDTPQVKCTDKRKAWLSKYNKNLYVDAKQNRVSYQDLINKELIHFSIYDNMRSIPSICDGLKPSQRKILYYMLKKNITKVIKVAQLSGYVSAETGYHHGEASLQQAIIGMAQDFVGSNNLNLLFPDGNFGSRNHMGKDAASPRYIYTKLNDLTSLIFNKKDVGLLNFLDDDGMSIEPEWYLPIIPMVLVNGCEGIGTGYSTYIPPFNPKDIIANLLRVLDNKDPLRMTPYFKNFKGILEEDPNRPGHYFTKGRYEVLSETQVKVTELPIGMGVTTYKEFLESLVEDNKNKTVSKKKQIILKDVQNKTKDENDQILFLIEFKNREDLAALIKSNGLEKELKLVKSFGTSNMNLFSEDLILTKYTDPNDILLDYFDLRLEYYDKRKEYLIKILKRQLKILENKARFISEYISGKLDINKKAKSVIEGLLEDRKYAKFGDVEGSDVERSDGERSDGERSDVERSDGSFDYLTRMPIISMSLEKVNELENACKEKRKELDTLSAKTDRDLWRDDLSELQTKLN
jgi:DNA topoisomerase-2